MKPGSSSQSPRLRPTLWRWHKYTGLFVGPFLVLASVTGALLVFPHATERLLRPDLWIVPVGSVLVDADRAVEAALQSHPAHRVFSVQQPARPDSPYYLWLIPDDSRKLIEVFVDPYTAEVLGDRVREDSFLRITEQLHRRLLAGTWGSIVVDLVTGWSIVLLLTGVFLWWPRTGKQLRSGLTINPRARPRQLNWRLHNAVGAYAMVWLLLLAATGMLVSEVTGAMYRMLMVATEATPKALARDLHSVRDGQSRRLPVKSIIQLVREATGTTHGLTVRFPLGSDGVYLVSTEVEGHQLSEYQLIAIDQYSGEVLAKDAWEDFHTLTKVRSYGLAIHFGTIGGLPTKLLAFAACLCVPVLAVSGALIWWWKRQKSSAKSSTMSPSRRNQPPPPSWLWGVSAVFCLLFPTVGVTAVMITLVNLVRRRLTSS